MDSNLVCLTTKFSDELSKTNLKMDILKNDTVKTFN
jgi:hypothetical protein